MCSIKNLCLIFVVFSCVFRALCLNDYSKRSLKRRHNIKNLLTWEPGEVVNRTIIDGNEIVFRVINGKPATTEEFPYIACFRKQVGKTKLYASFCGAAIISPTELLSAAHCFRKSNKVLDSCCRSSGRAEDNRIKGVYAVAGSRHAVSHFHTEDTTEDGQWRTIRTAVYPTDYNFPKNDIAVVFLESPFIMTNLVQAIPYAVKEQQYSGTCVLIGYGRIETGHV